MAFHGHTLKILNKTKNFRVKEKPEKSILHRFIIFIVLCVKIPVKECLSWSCLKRRLEGDSQVEKGTWSEMKRHILSIKSHVSKLEICSDGLWADGALNYR